MKPSNGVVILVLGIASCAGFGCLTGIPAWYLGNESLRNMDSGVSDSGDRSMVQIGRIMGMISTLLVGIIGAVWLIAFIGLLGAMHRP
jgi:hypothetical protein